MSLSGYNSNEIVYPLTEATSAWFPLRIRSEEKLLGPFAAVTNSEADFTGDVQAHWMNEVLQEPGWCVPHKMKGFDESELSWPFQGFHMFSHSLRWATLPGILFPQICEGESGLLEFISINYQMNYFIGETAADGDKCVVVGRVARSTHPNHDVHDSTTCWLDILIWYVM